MGRVPKALSLAPREHKTRFLQKQVHLGRLETLCAEAASSRFGELGVEVAGGSSSSPAFWDPGAASLCPRPRLPSRGRASSTASKSSRRAAPGRVVRCGSLGWQGPGARLRRAALRSGSPCTRLRGGPALCSLRGALFPPALGGRSLRHIGALVTALRIRPLLFSSCDGSECSSCL
nr:uncharacterized protein LOC119625925 [Chlorocebus sabaeus]